MRIWRSRFIRPVFLRWLKRCAASAPRGLCRAAFQAAMPPFPGVCFPSFPTRSTRRQGLARSAGLVLASGHAGILSELRPVGEDFGTGAPVRMADGKVRRPWVFRIVLSYSRKAYSEAVWRQSTESFITCLENAFRHFGGVPKRLVIDNLKAAVARADWYDPEIH